MILADTSIWIDYLRAGDAHLAQLLFDAQVMTHPFVIGELACGHLKNRKSILSLLNDLPAAPTATHEEVLFFIDTHSLSGKGLGYVDMHLLASTFMGEAIKLWTYDKRLGTIAGSLKINFEIR